MRVELRLADLAYLMRGVTSLATHVQSRVPAAFLGNIHSDFVATETEICLLISRFRLQQLVLILGYVWVMAFHAVANRWRMHRALQVGRILIRVAGQTQGL